MYSWWIENPKGRFRQKLGIKEKMIRNKKQQKKPR